MKIAVIGAGWAGLAAAVCAVQAGHAVSVWEASRTLGGRARAMEARMPDGSCATLDNGQHILIGAYTESLRLMRLVGVDPHHSLLRLPFALRYPDDSGIRFAPWPAPMDALAGIIGARGWSLADKAALARHALSWRLSGFTCACNLSVAALCQRLPRRVMDELVEPLCVSALNTPTQNASARVFLRVLRDAVFGASGGSNLLLPRVSLSALFPDAAAAWLERHGASVHVGARVRQLQEDGRWQVNGAPFDRVLLAGSASDTLHILANSLPWTSAGSRRSIDHWSGITRELAHTAITTVYAWARDARLARPMLALRCNSAASRPFPAQFVFDRGQLGGPPGLLAFVISASAGEREVLQGQVLEQARVQLGLALLPVRTVVEKRATLACTPGLRRPPLEIAPGLLACADYVDGPYPSTIEGAVRNALAATR